MSYHVNEKGYYGDFGGAYIPEMLYPNVKSYVKNTLRLQQQTSFKPSLTSYCATMLGDQLHCILPNDCPKNTTPKSI
jgi:tryptophan synthase beta chain